MDADDAAQEPHGDARERAQAERRHVEEADHPAAALRRGIHLAVQINKDNKRGGA